LCAAAAVGSIAAPAVASATTAPNTSSPVSDSVPAASRVAFPNLTPAAVSAMVQAVSAPAPAAAASVPAKAAAAVVPASYRVVTGDTLFGIAARTLGSGDRYPEIFKLNGSKVESDGRTFTDANLIQPGWTLSLPSGATAAATAPSAAAAPAPAPAPEVQSAPKTTTSSSKSSSSSTPAPQTTTNQSTSTSYGNNLDGWIKQAISILNANGVSVSYNAIYQTVMHESAGNPSATNGWDSNAAAGHPSIGLMQTIAPTFNAFALPGHYNIYNPVDNIIAGVRYAASRYGSLDSVVAARCGGSCWRGY
jgi:hypothetical protein